jgi:hypothetical protein
VSQREFKGASDLPGSVAIACRMELSQKNRQP